MKDVIQIQLGQNKFVDSINLDSYVPLQLERDTALLTEYGIDNVLNVNDQHELERQSSTTYRIYGEIEYFSILNNININASSPLEDYFISNVNGKSLLNSFSLSIVKPNNNYVDLNSGNTFQKYYEKISDVNLNLLPAGYSINVFGEKTFIYIADNLVNVDNKTLDVPDNYDKPYFPITDLYIYCKYIPTSNENLEYLDVVTDTYIEYITEDQTNMLGDVIQWDKENYLENEYSPLTHKITTQYIENSVTKYLEWFYNPLIKISIDVLSDDLTTAISGGTNDYDDPIPQYATMLTNGNYVWREIENKGYVNPLTNHSIDAPFINNSHYVFNKLKLSVTPNLSPGNTYEVFKQLFISYAEQGNRLNNLDGLNNKC